MSFIDYVVNPLNQAMKDNKQKISNRKAGEAQRKTDLDAQRAAGRAPRLASLTEGTTEQQGRMDQISQLHDGIGSRLGERRGLRQELADTMSQPQMQDIAEQEAQAKRQIGMEGSLGERRRDAVSSQADLARQDVQSQSFEQQIQTEQGMQNLQNEFSSMFNDMASTQFTQQLSGLGEEIDQYMAEKGRTLKYDKLATDAQASSDRMMGRLLDGMGRMKGEKKKDTSFSSGTEYTEDNIIQ